MASDRSTRTVTSPCCIGASYVGGPTTMMDINQECIYIGNDADFRQLAELVRAKVIPQLTLIDHTLLQDDPLQGQPVIELAQRDLGWQPSFSLEQEGELTFAYFEQFLQGAGSGVH